jgi:ankyrin repeat protein
MFVNISALGMRQWDLDLNLGTALWKNDFKTAEQWLNRGADINHQERGENNLGDTVLIQAIMEGLGGNDRNRGLRKVYWLTEHGADVNIPDNNGTTPLMWAAKIGSVPKVEHLLAEGASVSARNNKGETALILAAKNGHLEIVVMPDLLESATEGDMDSAIMQADFNYHDDVANYLNDYKANRAHWSATKGNGTAHLAKKQSVKVAKRTSKKKKVIHA